MCRVTSSASSSRSSPTRESSSTPRSLVARLLLRGLGGALLLERLLRRLLRELLRLLLTLHVRKPCTLGGCPSSRRLRGSRTSSSPALVQTSAEQLAFADS